MNKEFESWWWTDASVRWNANDSAPVSVWRFCCSILKGLQIIEDAVRSGIIAPWANPTRTHDTIIEMNHPGEFSPYFLELHFPTGMHTYLSIAEDAASLKVSVQATYLFTTRSQMVSVCFIRGEWMRAFFGSLLCALTEDCYQPPGAHLGCSGRYTGRWQNCHRYDQNAINVLLFDGLNVRRFEGTWTNSQQNPKSLTALTDPAHLSTFNFRVS